MACKSFHDRDYHGFFVRINEMLHFVTDEEVDRADGSVYKAVMDNLPARLPFIHHRSSYFASQLALLAK